MNFNLANILIAFSLSLSFHAGLVAVIAYSAGVSQSYLDSSVIAVEIIEQRLNPAAQDSIPQPQQAVTKAKHKTSGKPQIPSAIVAKAADSGQVGSGLGKTGVQGVHNVTLISAPKPPYPMLARQSGFEGTAIFELTVAASGLVKNAAIVQSTGRTDCDLAAQKTILEEWRFSALNSTANNLGWKQRVRVKYELAD